MIKTISSDIKRISGLLEKEINVTTGQEVKNIEIRGSRIGLCSKKGPSREHNQDRVSCVEIKNQRSTGANLLIAILSDGMGGMVGGKEAASISISSFVSYIALSKANGGLKKISSEAVEYANQCVYERFKGKGGATLSAIIFGSKGCVAVNVGDSRICFIDRGKKIKQITKDDTIKEQVRSNVEKDNVWLHPSEMDNRLAQHIGMGNGLLAHTFDLSRFNKDSSKNALFFITSDGAHFIGKTMIQKIYESCPDSIDMAERVVTVSEYLSGHDNMSVITISSQTVTEENIGGTDVEIITQNINNKITYFLSKGNVYDGNEKFQDKDFLENKQTSKSTNDVKVDSVDAEIIKSEKRPSRVKGKKEDKISKEKSKYKIDLIDFEDGGK